MPYSFNIEKQYYFFSARNTTEKGGRQLNENKALTSTKNRFNPYTPKFEGCRICKQKVHQVGSYYCKKKIPSSTIFSI